MFNIFPIEYWVMILLCAFFSFITGIIVIYFKRRARKIRNYELIQHGFFKGYYFYYTIIKETMDLLSTCSIIVMGVMVYTKIVPVNADSSYFLRIVTNIAWAVAFFQVTKVITGLVMIYALVRYSGLYGKLETIKPVSKLNDTNRKTRKT